MINLEEVIYKNKKMWRDHKKLIETVTNCVEWFNGVLLCHAFVDKFIDYVRTAHNEIKYVSIKALAYLVLFNYRSKDREDCCVKIVKELGES
jgi:hypothetical protein